MILPNRKISVLWVTGLKILGRVGTHIPSILNYFFLWKTKTNLKQILGFIRIFRYGQVTLNTCIFYLALLTYGIHFFMNFKKIKFIISFLNPFKPNEISQSYPLDQSVSPLRVVGSHF